MRAREIMTDSPVCCTPESTVSEAARFMADCDCGVVPVVEDMVSMRLVGVVTDRDLAVRVLAQRKGPDVTVRDVMTRAVCYCGPDDDVERVERVMAENQVRRVPIVDASGCCIGIVAQADLARAAEKGDGVSDREVARVVEKISEPSTQASGGTTGGARPEAGL